MLACLPVGGRGAQTLGGSSGGVATAIAAAGSVAERQSEDLKANGPLQAGPGDRKIAPRRTRGGQGHDSSVGGRDFCVAVSGGLASVLELLQPLWHVAWAGRDTRMKKTLAAELHGAGMTREILRMARVPSTWRRAAAAAATVAVAIEERKDTYNNHSAAFAAAASAAETAVENVDGGAEEFVVMCEDGWFGWYQSRHRRFMVSCLGVGTTAYNIVVSNFNSSMCIVDRLSCSAELVLQLALTS